MQRIVFAALLVGGCISGTYNSDMQVGGPDLSAAVVGPDMVTTYNFDLAGLDLGGLYNCKGLNKCEQGATPAQALMCEMNATPTARAKEAALQSCFKQWCPIVADMGTAVCAPNDMGTTSSACQTCINNTYVGAGSSCSPMTAPECHMCLQEAEVCLADQ